MIPKFSKFAWKLNNFGNNVTFLVNFAYNLRLWYKNGSHFSAKFGLKMGLIFKSQQQVPTQIIKLNKLQKFHTLWEFFNCVTCSPPSLSNYFTLFIIHALKRVTKSIFRSIHTSPQFTSNKPIVFAILDIKRISSMNPKWHFCVSIFCWVIITPFDIYRCDFRHPSVSKISYFFLCQWGAFTLLFRFESMLLTLNISMCLSYIFYWG